MPSYESMSLRGRGGDLPRYQGRGGTYAPGAGVSARVSDAAAGIVAAGTGAEAEAQGRLGTTLRASVRAGMSAYEDYSKTKATELFTRYKKQMRQDMYGDGGILTREGESAFTVGADTLERSRELRTELLQDMEGSLTESMFNSLVDPEEAEFSLHAQEYEARQYRVYQDRTESAAFEECAETAIHSYGNLPEFQKNVGHALYFQEKILSRAGYSGEALERGLKEGSSKIFAGAIQQALSSDDISGARQILEEGSRVFGKDKTRMTADDIAAAEVSIRNRADALQAKAEATARKVAAEKERKTVRETVDSFVTQVRELPEGEREGSFAELCEGIEDEELRKKVWNSGMAQLSLERIKENAMTNRQVREFQELARSRGWSQAQAEEQIAKAANLTDKAREILLDDYNGMKNKETPENRAAFAELRRMIDLGGDHPEGIDPHDDDAIENYARNYGLTNAQTKAAFSYRDSGGNVGTLTQKTVDAAARSLFPDDEEKAKKIAADLYPLVGDQLEPGKKATLAQVKNILSLLMTEGYVYRDWTTGGVKLRYRSTYEDALREGKGDDFLVTVPPADSERIAGLLRQNGIKVTPERISRYYFDELRKH